jgi:2-keto-4-pentenoate hydratase/2-oxohepta-3-ene-1,7-dioic acid hydratase in catechol pathway
MPAWTHLIRFIAVEDCRTHIGQLVDTSRDVGLDSVNGTKIEAYLINGTIFDGEVTDQILTVKQILSPVSMEDCNYIRCLGLNYMDHAKVRPLKSWGRFGGSKLTSLQEANMALPKAPILFTKPRTALTDPYPAAIPIPKCAQDGTSDYEAELCVVIGKSGRNIPEEKALDYVLGYTASNDVSARTLQMLTTQWSFSKGLDGSCPVGQSQTAPPSVFHCLLCIGPVLVSPKIITDPQTLSVKAIYNGQTVQDGNTK